MAYSDFKLNELLKQFDLAYHEQAELFANFPEVAPSELLNTLLKENVNLAVAINTEKA